MSQVLTEGTNLAVVVETTLGAATPPTSGWINVEPNSYGDSGPSFKKLPRTPITKTRQRQKPILVDLDSAMPFEHDLTKDAIDVFIEGIFASAIKHSGGTGLSIFRPTAVVDGGASPDEYTVAASGAIQANTLIYARGFVNSANNGLKAVVATSSATAIKVATASLVAESVSPTGSAMVEVAGWQGASGDITMNGSGNLTSTAADFTTMGLNVGQWIWVGGTTGGANAFATAAYRGFARIKTIAANLLTLERRSWTVGSSDSGAGKTIHIYFSRWIRNVSIDSADHLKRSYAFEVTYPDLGGVGTPEYEYSVGQILNEFVLNFPLAGKSTINFGFIGTNTQDPTSSRATGPSVAFNPMGQLAVGTSTDLLRLRMSNTDETGVTTDFTSLKVSIKNNVEAEKQLGQLGAVLMNLGAFEVSIEAEVIFTSDSIIKGIRDNRTVSFDIGMRNGDFGALLDIPSATIDEGDKKFETNKSVGVSAQCMAFRDQTLGLTASLSVFPFVPSA